MLIGFIGDLHGHVFEALAVLVRWQKLHGRRLDLIVQLGDFGPPDEPDADTLATYDPRSYERLDPGQFDVARLIRADGDLARTLESVRERLAVPILFIRGNHEDEGWLEALRSRSRGVVEADPFGIFAFVPDGHIQTFGGTRVAFLGGSAPDDPAHGGRVDAAAAARLASLGPDQIDVLVTHDRPYGIGRGYYGDVQGSRAISEVLERLRPRVHVTGHLHHVVAGWFGATRFYGLAALSSDRWDPKPGVMPGSLAVLNTEGWTMEFVDEPWLGSIGGFGVRFDITASIGDILDLGG